VPALLSPSTSPRSRRTLTELIDRVRGDLGLRDSSLLTDNDIGEWLREGQDIIAQEAGWYWASTPVDSVNGTKEYAIPNPSSGVCISIQEVIWDTRQLPMHPVDELLLHDPYYRSQGVGAPFMYYLTGNSSFGLHYTPAQTTPGIITVIYIGLPPRVTAPNETFYVPHGGEKGLITYAKKLGSEKDAHGEGRLRMQQYAVEWQQDLEKIKQQVGEVAGREILIVGEDGHYDWSRHRTLIPWSTVDPA
jgi:hypothetical protein